MADVFQQLTTTTYTSYSHTMLQRNIKVNPKLELEHKFSINHFFMKLTKI